MNTHNFIYVTILACVILHLSCKKEKASFERIPVGVHIMINNEYWDPPIYSFDHNFIASDLPVFNHIDSTWSDGREFSIFFILEF